jgi:hypothetical protein
VHDLGGRVGDLANGVGQLQHRRLLPGTGGNGAPCVSATRSDTGTTGQLQARRLSDDRQTDRHPCCLTFGLPMLIGPIEAPFISAMSPAIWSDT